MFVRSLGLKKASSGNLAPCQLVYGIEVLLPFIIKLFNRLFTNGEFPKAWAKSIIVPIHKKGCIHSPNNYRGIALFDVLCKLYISIITKRVTFYAEAYDKITESQAGFRSNYSTIDNAFVLYSVISYVSTRI